MRFEHFAVAESGDAKKGPLPIRGLRLIETTEMGVPPGGDIKADLYLTYTLRHVVSGDTTYEEKDDVVREITTGPVRRPITLVSAREAREASRTGYSVFVGRAGLTPRQLAVSLQGGRSEPLCFGTRDEAASFVGYLRSHRSEDPSLLADARIGVLSLELDSNHPSLKLGREELAAVVISTRCI